MARINIMFNNLLSYIFTILSIVIFLCAFPLCANATYTQNGFFVISRLMDFRDTVRSAECSGTIVYPELSNDEQSLFITINDTINYFINQDAVCNIKNSKERLSLSYDIPMSKSQDFFSIRWFTKNHNKILRIDTLNFHTYSGHLVKPSEIFNMLSNNLMHKMIDLSQGYLDEECSWEQFISKIKDREIQIYIKNKEWYIVFNNIITNSPKEAVNIKIPEYFLKGNVDYDRG